MNNAFKRLICKVFKRQRRGKIKHDYCQKCYCNYRGFCVAHIIFNE